MPDLNALIVFANVADALSFTVAARRLGRPVSTVSRKVAELENQLGVRLLERSTRSLRLTDIGEEVFREAQKSVELSDAIQSIVSNHRAEVKGTLRLSAPPSISDTVLAPLVVAFQSAYPEVDVHILVTERSVDHIVEGIDLEFSVGLLPDSSLMRKRVLLYRHQLVCSPNYLASVEAPSRPQDLLNHPLLAFSHWHESNTWTFVRKKRAETIAFQPHLAMNDYLGLAKALESGAGIGDLPPIVCPDLMNTGKLVEVMPSWHFRAVDVSLLHLSNRHLPRMVRLFIDHTTQFLPSLFESLPD